MSERALLMIPGPIEFEPSVMQAMGEKTRSHLDPVFMAAFGRALKRTREVFQAPSAQPFVIAGSGTLAMELAVANLIEPGDSALVVNTGFFSDRIAKMLERHGAAVTHVRAPPGDAPPLDEVKKALSAKRFKVITITHVDTSTAVLAPVKQLAALAREHDALCIVDGVCSVGGEALEQDAWGVDVALTASQKALGTPPGLAVLCAGPRALAAFRARKKPPASVYLDWNEWLPIHEAYEAGKPAYFATPAVNLIAALDVSLGQLLAEGMPARVARHARIAAAANAAWAALGLSTLPVRDELRAHTLSALYFPAGVDATLVKRIADEGVTVAGGLHPDLRTKYFRVGHMGATGSAELLTTIGAIERALKAAGANIEAGAGLAAAQRAL
jgi:alanine-glyoxylate transaminase/serine-glyoxylate transaminase/serine-pyruvate transaminase